MITSRFALATFLCLIVLPHSRAEEFDGIEFPAGSISFADRVVSYEPGHGNGSVPTHEDFTDPAESLEAPDYPRGQDMQPGSVSLGSGGRLVLQFVDNALTGSGNDQPDLHIFEVGSDVEDTFVEISRDGREWNPIGKVSGAISSIDIDAFGFSTADEFRYVRLTDDAKEGHSYGETVGADIDAVGAISTVPRRTLPTWWMLIFSIAFIGIAFLIWRTGQWKQAPCIRYLWVSFFLILVLLVTWLFSLSLQATWLVFLFLVTITVILFSWRLIGFARKEGLSPVIPRCS